MINMILDLLSILLLILFIIFASLWSFTKLIKHAHKEHFGDEDDKT